MSDKKSLFDPWPWPAPEPGVYFNMSFEDYLAIPCLSNSGVKSLLVAGPNFWAESWLNPFKKYRKTKPHEKEGRAYHCRLLEGSAAFYAQYAPDYEDDGDPKMLRGNDAMIAFLKSNAVKGLSGKTAAELDLLCSYCDAEIPTLFRAKKEHRSGFAETVEFLPAHEIREIELSVRVIEKNPHMNHWIMGGYPEVTVIFRHPVTGLLFKARFDYLKIGAVTDLKTFANERGKQIDKAVNAAIAGYSYIIQPAVYMPAAQAARSLIADGKVFGADRVDPKWLEMFSATPVSMFRFIFCQKGQAMVVRGRTVRADNKTLHEQGSLRVDQAMQTFMESYAEFGEEIWLDSIAPQELYFEDLPAFVNDL